MKRYISLAGLALSLLLSSSVFAQTTQTSGSFSVQGMLTTTAGNPIADGAHSLVINVYNNASGVVAYTQNATVNTTNGIFSTMVGGSGSGSGSLNLQPNVDYTVGVAVDGQAELTPRMKIGSVPTAIVANLAGHADSANTVGGFSLSSNGNGQLSVSGNGHTNLLPTLNNAGKLNANLLDTTGLVTSINGLRGNINFTGSNGLSITPNGSGGLNFTGGGSGGFTLPYTQTTNLATGTAFNITNSLAGSAATFANTGLGAALNATAATGSAIVANATGGSSAAIDATNTVGTALNASSTSGTALSATSSTGSAISATGSSATNAVLNITSNAGGSAGNLISATNNGLSRVFNVAANGQTTIASTATTALDVSTAAAGGSALNVSAPAGSIATTISGGLRLLGPVGTGSIGAGSSSAVIMNPLIKANSIIFLTVNSATELTPIKISSQAAGTFTASLMSVGVLGTALNFNYLIINQ